jgi:hypothetical protein
MEEMSIQKWDRSAAGILMLAALALGVASAAQTSRSEGAQKPAKPAESLYERLGAMKGINELSNRFVGSLTKPEQAAMTRGHKAEGTAAISHKETKGSYAPEKSAGRTMEPTTGAAAPSAKSKTPATSSVPMTNAKQTGEETERATSDRTTSASVAKAPEAKNVNATVNAPPSSQQILREYVAARLCQVAGGSCQDPVTPLSEIRGKLTITDAQWTRAMKDFRTILERRNIEKADQDATMSALSALEHDVAAAGENR